MPAAEGVRPAVFEAYGLIKRFGGQQALNSVDFSLRAGCIKGIVGTNGAGKSTLLKIMAGAVQPDGGEMHFEGRLMRPFSMQDAQTLGIAMVPQERQLFPSLTVLENFWLVHRGREDRVLAARCANALERLGLKVSLNTLLGSLSAGEQQLVEVARSLSMSPRLLILDEPTASLRNDEVERLHRVIRGLRDQGLAIVYVSHFIEEVLEVTDSVTILRDGAVVVSDFPSSPEGVFEVVEHMLGARMVVRADGLMWTPGSRRAGQPTSKALRVTGLRGPNGLQVDEFTAHGGEVVGVTGLIGAGVEGFFRVLFGFERAAAGQVVLPGGESAPRSVADAVRKRVALVPGDRKRHGLMLDRSISANIAAVRSLALGREGFLLNRQEVLRRAAGRCLQLGIGQRSSQSAGPVRWLSSGHQQKIVIAKWLEADPDLFLLDDPTRGVDIGAKKEIYDVIRCLAADGRVVLMNSSDPGELIEVCDRVVVFVRGCATVSLPTAALSEQRLLDAMNGDRRSVREVGSEEPSSSMRPGSLR